MFSTSINAWSVEDVLPRTKWSPLLPPLIFSPLTILNPGLVFFTVDQSQSDPVSNFANACWSYIHVSN